MAVMGGLLVHDDDRLIGYQLIVLSQKPAAKVAAPAPAPKVRRPLVCPRTHRTSDVQHSLTHPLTPFSITVSSCPYSNLQVVEKPAPKVEAPAPAPGTATSRNLRFHMTSTHDITDHAIPL
jgi:hypothetical protein